MSVQSLDHLVLTIASLEDTLEFYCDGLGMSHETFGDERHCLRFGSQKINLHIVGFEFEPKAMKAMPGSADLCFLVANLANMLPHLAAQDIPILEGPVARSGATGPLTSIYIRDPDGNLIELSERVV